MKVRADDRRTIYQDVQRTRGDVAFFRSSSTRHMLRLTLEAFCVFYGVNYMQGLNEILAPILTVGMAWSPSSSVVDYDTLSAPNSPTTNLPSREDFILSSDMIQKYRMNMLLFERLVKCLCPATFASKGVNALQAQLSSFHLLLTYHDPSLSMFLRKRCIDHAWKCNIH